jgi:hypothetical protein
MNNLSSISIVICPDNNAIAAQQARSSPELSTVLLLHLRHYKPRFAIREGLAIDTHPLNDAAHL